MLPLNDNFDSFRLIFKSFLRANFPKNPIRKSPSTEVRSKIFAFIHRATILAVCTLQRWVIQQKNGNFMGFLGIFLKIVKNCPMKHNLHLSGKW